MRYDNARNTTQPDGQSLPDAIRDALRDRAHCPADVSHWLYFVAKWRH
jgi:hypothetical protein